MNQLNLVYLKVVYVVAKLSISASARAVGKDRGTIQRYIKSGKLSATKNTAGNNEIDTAELIRVFGELQQDGNKQSAVKQQETAPESHILQLTIETLREQLKTQQQEALEREAWLKAQLEAEQERSRELERRMLPPAEEATTEKKGFWARVFGK